LFSPSIEKPERYHQPGNHIKYPPQFASVLRPINLYES
jgi:hypothetical protein